MSAERYIPAPKTPESTPDQDSESNVNELREVQVLKMNMEAARRILRGEQVFGDILWEKLQSNLADAEAVGVSALSEEVREMVAQLPGAEINNMFNNAQTISTAGDFSLARTWLSEARTRMGTWIEKGALTQHQQSELTARYDSLIAELFQENGQGEISKEYMSTPDEPRELRALKLYVEEGEKITMGRRVFGDTIFTSLERIFEETETYESNDEVSVLRDKAEQLLKALPLSDLNNIFSRAEGLLAIGKSDSAKEWLEAARSHLHDWEKQGVLHGDTVKAFHWRERELAKKIGIA